jgi:hypothetical protein
MRKLVGSVVIGMALVAALMVFAGTSLASRPESSGALADAPPPEQGSERAISPVKNGDPPPVGERLVSLRGTIADLPTDTLTGTWTITDQAGSSWTIMVTEETKIVPPVADPAPGDPVRVLGKQEEDTDYTVIASLIAVRERNQQRARPVQFRGEIQALPVPTETVTGSEAYYGEWVVAGYTFTVDSRTMIHPDKRTPEVGMLANVIAFEQPDGTLWAKNIALHGPEEDENEVEIEGIIEQLPEPPFLGTWVVDGFTVTVTETTELKGATPAVSLTAEVEGRELEDGTILADEITVEEPEQEEVEFEGSLLVFTDTTPSEWVIETETATGTEQVSVTVTSDTYVDTDEGPLEVGAWVEVEALRQADGSLVAVRIEVEDDVEEDVRVEIEGTVVATDTIPGDWVIETDSERITVEVTSRTRVVPPWASLELGSEVEIKALQRPDDTLLALVIHIEGPDPELMEIEGTIVATDTIPGGWVIETESERITVEVTSYTRVVPPWTSLKLGDEVEVKALRRPDDTPLALVIHIERPEPEIVEIEGTIAATDTIPGDWVIETESDHITVEVTSYTMVVPPSATLELGTEVEVEALRLSEDTLRALRIEVVDDDDGILGDGGTFDGTAPQPSVESSTHDDPDVIKADPGAVESSHPRSQIRAFGQSRRRLLYWQTLSTLV